MEGSTAFTLQEIEKLKTKISGYRNSLMTLKMESSFEDLQLMKREFNELKTYLSYIEGLMKTMEEKQYSQNENYEEQIQQLSVQIATMYKTVDEMGQEIASISNQLVHSEDEAIRTDQDDEKKANSKVNPISTKTPEKTESPIVLNEPSYMQLRNLTNQVLQLQEDEENITPVEQAQDLGNRKDQRFFNQHYFQSINNQSNNSFQKRYNNSLGATLFQFKNAAKNEEIPTSVSSKGIDAAHEIEIKEPQENNLSIITESSTSSIVSASHHDDVTIEIQQQSQSEVLDEELTEYTEAIEEKNKKQKTSSFFNIFRK